MFGNGMRTLYRARIALPNMGKTLLYQLSSNVAMGKYAKCL